MILEPQRCEDGRIEAEFAACTGKGVGQGCVLADGARGECARLLCSDEPSGERFLCVGIAAVNDAGLPVAEGAGTGGELSGGGCALSGIAPQARSTHLDGLAPSLLGAVLVLFACRRGLRVR
ncbi:MAG: hypothetical protein U0174_06475 [Polyangiaceae bacterium]